jgi:hypothetical protein
MHARFAAEGFGRFFLNRRSLAIAAGFILHSIAAAEDLTTAGKEVTPAKAEDHAKERKLAELDAFLKASREQERLAELQRGKLSEAYTVTPRSAQQGISLEVDPRAKLKEEVAARWRMELYGEEEIARKLASFPVKVRLRVTWRRSDYDGAASQNFKLILSDTAGKVLYRVEPEYRAPKQAGEGDYVNGMTLNLENDPGAEFRVRIVDGNRNVYADFVVRGTK